jgi:hypothetical protein
VAALGVYVASIVAIGADAWQTLCILHALADDGGVVRLSKNEIALKTKMTVQTLNKRLSALGDYIVIDSVGNIRVRPANQAAQALETFFTHVLDKDASFVLNDSSNTCVKISDSDVINRFIERYNTRYGEKPRIDWRLARNSAKAFIRRYGDKSLAIIDAAFDNYDTTWRKPAYPRPSFGAMMSWLGEQSSAYVETQKGDVSKTKVEDLI